jgi:hypothetical protein
MPEQGTDFADLLRQHRNGLGLTREALSEATDKNVSVTTIKDIERRAVRRPQSRTVEFLAKALALQGQERLAFLAAARRGSLRPSSAEPEPGDGEVQAATPGGDDASGGSPDPVDPVPVVPAADTSPADAPALPSTGNVLSGRGRWPIIVAAVVALVALVVVLPVGWAAIQRSTGMGATASPVTESTGSPAPTDSLAPTDPPAPIGPTKPPGSCTGEHIDTYPHKQPDGIVVASTWLYASADGTICAELKKSPSLAAYYGTPSYLSVQMCDSTGDACDIDRNVYPREAGPVSLQTGGGCVHVLAYGLDPEGHKVLFDDDTGPVHCLPG